MSWRVSLSLITRITRPQRRDHPHRDELVIVDQLAQLLQLLHHQCTAYSALQLLQPRFRYFAWERSQRRRRLPYDPSPGFWFGFSA